MWKLICFRFNNRLKIDLQFIFKMQMIFLIRIFEMLDSLGHRFPTGGPWPLKWPRPLTGGPRFEAEKPIHNAEARNVSLRWRDSGFRESLFSDLFPQCLALDSFKVKWGAELTYDLKRSSQSDEGLSVLQKLNHIKCAFSFYWRSGQGGNCGPSKVKNLRSRIIFKY